MNPCTGLCRPLPRLSATPPDFIALPSYGLGVFSLHVCRELNTYMTTGYMYHESFGWHDTGSFVGDMPSDITIGLQPYHNWEHADTKRRIHELIVVSGLINHLKRIEPRDATEEELRLVHTQRHIDFIKSQSELRHGGDAGDWTTPFGKGGYGIFIKSVGGILEMVDAVFRGEIKNGYALSRPPGHHARPDQGMGYCVFNHGSIAVKYAQKTYGVKRVLVVDWDVHWGNGTQEVFFEDNSVVTISIHQDRLYPKVGGMVDEVGSGTNINVPLSAGGGNEAYLKTIVDVVIPAIERFKPEIIFVASGFDSCVFDPLGRMAVTAKGYREMTRKLMQAADTYCEGRLVMHHEGGYSAHYSPICGQAVLQELSGVFLLDDPFDEANGYPNQKLNPINAAEILESQKLLKNLPT